MMTDIKDLVLPQSEQVAFSCSLRMVADVYSHIIDEERRLNAQRFEEAFYSGQGNAALTAGQADQTAMVPEKNAGGNGESDQELLRLEP